MNYCKCGCGLLVEKNYKQGHGRRGKHNSPEHNLALLTANKNRVYSEEEITRLRNNAIKQRGKPISEDMKKRLSEIAKKIGSGKWMKGRRLPEIVRQKVSQSNMGRIVSDETRKKISEANSGSKNGCWCGGTSFFEYPPEFKKLKKLIRKRDIYTCQECGFTEEKLGYALSVHHIDFNKKNNVPSNLVSLCRSCHSQTNFNRADWIVYFQEKIRRTNI